MGTTRARHWSDPKSRDGEAKMNWRRFLRRDAADSELRDELELYVDLTSREYIARGMSATEAKAAARRKLGNATSVREEVYQMNTLTFVDSVLRDMRYAFRMIRTNLASASLPCSPCRSESGAISLSSP